MNKLLIAAVCSLLAALSIIGPNGYTYGNLDHEILIPFVKDFLHPELYPNDLLIEQRTYFYTVSVPLIAYAFQLSGVPLPYICFALYFFFLTLTFVAAYHLTWTLFRRVDACAVMLLLLLFYQGHLAGARTIETILIPRMMAVPFVLFGFSFLLRKRSLAAGFSLGTAFLFHPISAVIALLFIVFNLKGVKFLGAFAIISAPMIIWMIQYRVPSAGLLVADPAWLEVMRTRLPHHHFPFSWDWSVWAQALLRLIVFLIAWRHQPVHGLHSFVRSFTIAFLVLAVIGTIFTEWIPVPAIVQLQLFRGFSFLIFFILAYYANFFVMEVTSPQTRITEKLAASVLSAGILLVLVPVDRPPYRNFYFLLVVAIALIAILYEHVRKRPVTSRGLAAIVLAAVVVVGAGKGSGAAALHIGPNFPAEWTARQQWARENTQHSSLFIVPPGHKGFRVISERPVYADWKDGGLSFANPHFAVEWAARMQALKAWNEEQSEEGYRSLGADDFKNIVNSCGLSAAYVVAFADMKMNELQLVHKTASYNVYAVF